MACNNLIWDEDVLLIAENLAEAIVLKNDSKTILNQKSINDFNENNKKKLVLYSYDLEKLNYDTEGLLGLVNLGSTCFFNCVIQALLHTPIVRDYFLGQNHVCKFKNGSMCLLCELNRIQNAVSVFIYLKCVLVLIFDFHSFTMKRTRHLTLQVHYYI